MKDDKVLQNHYKKLNNIQQLKRILIINAILGKIVRSLETFRFKENESYVSLTKLGKPENVALSIIAIGKIY